MTRRSILLLILPALLAACEARTTAAPEEREQEPAVEIPSGPGSHVVPRRAPIPGYRDGRPVPAYQMLAKDTGVVLRHGEGAGPIDAYGARDVWVWEDGGTYYMHYDAAGPTGWIVALATSADLLHWKKHGLVLDLGLPHEADSRSASYGVTYREGDEWHMFYLATPQVHPGPDRVPMGPYLTLKAKASSPAGPWTKQRDVIPFWPAPGTFYEGTASPGHVVNHEGQYLQYFSAAVVGAGSRVLRTIGLARTYDLDASWRVNPDPVLPLTEQVENAALYYEPANGTWFMFVNHVGMDEHATEYTDAIWVYWSRNPYSWSPHDKALVLDGRSSTWSKRFIGLPSVVKVGNRLALFYDGRLGNELPSGTGQHMRRDIGLAWLELPLNPP